MIKKMVVLTLQNYNHFRNRPKKTAWQGVFIWLIISSLKTSRCDIAKRLLKLIGIRCNLIRFFTICDNEFATTNYTNSHELLLDGTVVTLFWDNELLLSFNYKFYKLDVFDKLILVWAGRGQESRMGVARRATVTSAIASPTLRRCRSLGRG